MSKISFINLTRGNEIGANCYYLEFGKQGVALDSGMHPKLDGYEALPNFDLIKKRDVSAIFVSHAHHDHIGALPLLMHRHLDAKVFMGLGTYFLGDPLLHNSVSVMKKQKKEFGIEEYPLYTNGEIKKIVERWQACHLNQQWSLEGHPLGENFDKKKDEVTFEFHHAGHILGGVAVELRWRNRRILYTGDVNFADQTIMKGATLPKDGIDTLMIEATRGANETPEGYSRNKVVKALLRAINETFERGGAVMIPVFAMGKTQEVLTLLHEAQKRGDLPHAPIYIGGLSRVFTEIYDRLGAAHPLQMLEDIHPEVMNGKLIANLKPKKGHIYLISSGMMTENTLSNVLSQRILARENDSILFVGYTDPNSPAGRLRATPRGHRVEVNRQMGEQPVLCHVEYFDLTSHAIREDILGYIQELNPKKCVLVHGDLPAIEWVRDQVKEKCPHMKVIVPAPGKEIEI